MGIAISGQNHDLRNLLGSLKRKLMYEMYFKDTEHMFTGENLLFCLIAESLIPFIFEKSDSSKNSSMFYKSIRGK